MPTINKSIVARVAGVAAIATATFLVGIEGDSNKVYVDPVGHKAVCVGHDSTGPDGKPLRAGDVLTDDVCSYLLGQDIKVAQDVVLASYAAREQKRPLTEGETVSYTSFTFNAGKGAWRGSTMLRKLLAGDYKGACNALRLWNKGTVRGRLVVIPGLDTRRRKEEALCLSTSPVLPVE